LALNGLDLAVPELKATPVVMEGETDVSQSQSKEVDVMVNVDLFHD
jgi:hypothetical protein